MSSFARFTARITVALSATAIVPLAIFQTPLPAKASSFSQIIAFGDSLVDTGNAFAQTGIPPAPYFEGHFSNGPIWTEQLAAELGIPQTSLGFGGALSDESGLLLFGGGPVAPVPGTLAQVNTFVSDPMISVDPDALYVIWAGANDYLFGEQTDPLTPVGNINTAVTTLSGAGAENFLLVNLPNLGELPLLDLINAPSAQIDGLNTLSALHNQALADTASMLNLPGTINVDLLDVNSLFASVLAGELGFANTTDACTLSLACVGDPIVQSTYLFWDEVHPTTTGHRIVANAALTQVNHVPEPSMILGIVLLLGLGIYQKKRKLGLMGYRDVEAKCYKD